MNNKTTYTAALIALGLVSAASAQTRIQITGSTAFRGNFFSAATAASGGIFDTTPTVLPAGANGSSGTIVYSGTISSAPYVLACVWSGSEAGIANLAGKSSLQNPGYPASLPGVSTVFPSNTGTAGTSASQADLALADTSQAVSLTPKSVANLHDFGTLGAVTFTWVKGKNSSPDASWNHLTNVSEYAMATALPSTVGAGYLTGVSTDADPVFIVGRNAGSGTRANTLLDLNQVPSSFNVSQAALNSFYPASGVLTYNIVKTAGGTEYSTTPPVTPANDALDSAASYPTFATCFANGVSQSSATASTVPNFVGVGDDGYDSGAFVSDCLSIDMAGDSFVVVGYAGISDATHAENGVPFSATETAPSQPGGAVWLNLDGVPYSDAAVVIGKYPFWGHEHLYGQVTPSTAAVTVASRVYAALNGSANAGQLGNGTAGPSAGIQGTVMACDKPSGGDAGYPAPVSLGAWGEAYNP